MCVCVCVSIRAEHMKVKCAAKEFARTHTHVTRTGHTVALPTIPTTTVNVFEIEIVLWKIEDNKIKCVRLQRSRATSRRSRQFRRSISAFDGSPHKAYQAAGSEQAASKKTKKNAIKRRNVCYKYTRRMQLNSAPLTIYVSNAIRIEQKYKVNKPNGDNHALGSHHTHTRERA